MAMPEVARRRSSRARQRFENLMHAQQKFIRLTHLQQGLAADACATETPAPDVQATDLRNRGQPPASAPKLAPPSVPEAAGERIAQDCCSILVKLGVQRH